MDTQEEPPDCHRLLPQLHDQCESQLQSLSRHRVERSVYGKFFFGHVLYTHSTCMWCVIILSQTCCVCGPSNRYFCPQEILRDFAMSVAQVSSTSLQDE